jgi:ParB/RepB/Spo0J family partition protein
MHAHSQNTHFYSLEKLNMAGKLKSAPRAKKPTTSKQRGIAGIKTVEEITDAEREGVLAKLVAQFDITAQGSANPVWSDDEAAQVWRRGVAKFNPKPVTLVCGTKLTVLDDGVKVEAEDRVSVIMWEEVVEYCRTAFATHDADNPKPRHVGDILNTTTPGGIEALDPDAIPASNGKPRGRAAASQATADVGDLRTLPLALFDRNPFQPREDFNAEELKALGDSIEATGLAHPLIVREVAGRYQVADGERRWRAVSALGWTEAPAVVRELSDQQMAEMAVTTAEQRAALSPIELARAFQRLSAEFGLTQTELGQRYGISQGQVSNTLRLLRLPLDIQRRIISREIPASHARLLVPWAEAHEDFWAALTKESKLGTAPIVPLEEWPEVIEQAALPWKFDIDGKPWCSKCCTSLELKPTEAELAELVIVEFDGRKVATNRAAFKNLEARARREYLKAHPEKAAKAASKPGQRVVKAMKPGTKAGEASCTPQMLRQWLKSWQCSLVSQAVLQLDPVKQRLEYWRVRVYAEIVFEDFYTEFSEALGVKSIYGGEDKLAAEIEALPLAKLEGAHHAALLAAVRFNVKTGPSTQLRYASEEALASLIKLLRIDYPTAWKKDLAGPLTRPLLELHSREQLHALAAEYGQMASPPSTSKKALVDKLIRCPRLNERPPKSLQELIEPPKAAKAKAKSKGAKKR